MKLNQLYNRITLDDWFIYQNPIFKPFIDCYYKSNQKSKFKLFHAYFFQFNRMHEYYKELFSWNESYFLPNGNLNFKKKQVRDMFYPHNLSYFIGYTYNLSSVFLHLTLMQDDYNYLKSDKVFFYDYTGFMQCKEDRNDDYSYLISDPKEFGILKNIHVKYDKHVFNELESYEVLDETNADPIIVLSSKTLKYLNNLN